MAGARRSTRQRKSITIQEYRFGSSDEESAPREDTLTPNAEGDDQDFDDGDFNAEAADEEVDDLDMDVDVDDADMDLDPGPDGKPRVPRTRNTPKAARGKRASFRRPHTTRRRRAAPPARKSVALAQLMPHDPHPQDTTSYLPLDVFPTDIRHTRMYRGPIPRNMTGYSLVQHLAGPDRQEIDTLGSLVTRWFNHHIFPSKVPGDGADPVETPWVAEGFEAMTSERFFKWFERWRRDEGTVQTGRVLEDDEKWEYEFGVKEELAALLGPYDSQKEFRFSTGDACCIDVTGMPCTAPGEGEEDIAPHGWMLDVGGLVLASEWMPSVMHCDQILALSIIPFSDQDVDRDPTAVDPADQPGCVQLWEFAWDNHHDGYVVPTRAPPRRIKTLCVDWGRVRKLKWCPVPMPAEVEDGGLGLMATLTGDGIVRVIQVYPAAQDATHERVETPLVSLSLSTESTIPATAFTWCNMNRICIGHADGSLSLWSLFPRALLSRHAVAHTHILNIQSAYPSSPYVIAVAPIAGLVRVVDLRNPSSETTTTSSASINTQPSTMTWSEHMQSFLSLGPTSNPYSTGVVMFPARHFGALGRRILRPASPPTCVAVGGMHPHTLVGLVDGCLWATNPMRLIFAAKSTTAAHKLCVFQHEFKPAQRWPDSNPHKNSSALRGAVRILSGWPSEPNRTLHTEKGKKGGAIDDDDDAEPTPVKDKKVKSKPKGNKNTVLSDMNRERGVVFEPLTRLTAVAWNPNAGFACWAAVAMGSGLVRIMDLGMTD